MGYQNLNQIIQVVPRLPPAVDGVGDYALLLARQLRAAHGIQTVFIVCDPTWKLKDRGQKSDVSNQRPEVRPPTSDLLPPVWLDGFPVYQVQERNYQLLERSVEALLRVLNQPGMPDTVLLQYVGYGYQKRGCPIWLAQALRAWRHQGSVIRGPVVSSLTSDFRPPTSRRLVTMFHEISAAGPVWRSAFWIAPLQRRVAKALAQSSNHSFTNMTLHAQVLQTLTDKDEANFPVLPVFSNVGEPAALPAWNERAPRMIVFGSASWRRQVYAEHRAELEAACQAFDLDEIADIGSPVELPNLSRPVLRRGILSAAEVSRDLLAARTGFFSCPINCLGKSGIFAAYAAHGLLPVTFAANPADNLDGLIPGRHFTTTSLQNQHTTTKGEDPGHPVHAWYQPHSITAQANQFAKALLPS